MPTSNIARFRELAPDTGSFLALDLSKRRIGLAGTDVGRSLVTPLFTYQRQGFEADLSRIGQTARARQASALIVGWPLNMDGTTGPRAQSATDTSSRLEQALDLPVFLQDERLSTEAVRQAIDDGRWPRPRAGAAIDHLAAAVILEDFLLLWRRGDDDEPLQA
ncbi:MAG: Holliday junction resolvase RuvX [Geminicoccaceae bacterium]